MALSGIAQFFGGCNAFSMACHFSERLTIAVNAHVSAVISVFTFTLPRYNISHRADSRKIEIETFIIHIHIFQYNPIIATVMYTLAIIFEISESRFSDTGEEI